MDLYVVVGEKMNIYQCLIALHAISLKEIRRFLRVWPQSIVSPSIHLILYCIIFQNLAQPLHFSTQSIAYIDFISPALILMGVITASFDNSNLSFFNARFRHTLDEQLVSPMSNHLIIMGYVLGSLTRAIIVALIALAVALVFTQLSIAHPLIMFITIVFSSVIFSLLGLISAFFLEDFDQLNIIPNFVLTPLLLFSGIFFSIDQLEPSWQWVYHANPLSYLIDSMRYSILDHQAPLLSSIFMVSLFSLIMLYGVTLSLLKTLEND